MWGDMTEKLKLPTLLLISDNPSIQQWLKKHLEGQFYIIDAARKALALEIAQYAELNFIILDSHFEECDPLELSKELRQINTVTPILLITGRLKKAFRDAALDAGITDFLNDQLAIEELETRIATGRKAAVSRIKTTELSSHIKGIQTPTTQDFFKNKVLLNEKALRLLADMKKQKDSIVLLLVRIDHFQEMLTNVGLIETEELLLPLSNRFHRTLRPNDLLIPSSNGLFIVLLPHTTIEESNKIAEQLRRIAQQEPFLLHQQALHLTISIAISPLEASEKEYKRMLAHATKALHQSQTMTNIIISLDKESP